MSQANRQVDYAAVLRAFAALCGDEFGSRREFTRTWKDFSQYPQEDLQRGVACLISAGIGSYPYEQGTTECGRIRLRLVVFGVLLEPDAGGEQIEEAEFEAIAELERIAIAAQEVDALGELKLMSVEQSQQAEAPYWWVATEWQLFVEGDEDE